MLIVAHAISLDSCTRQLVGQPARSQVSDAPSSDFCYHILSLSLVFGCFQQVYDIAYFLYPILLCDSTIEFPV